jgi:diadenosine tetraphosphate (Ap4A) HIT family hydrolase
VATEQCEICDKFSASRMPEPCASVGGMTAVHSQDSEKALEIVAFPKRHLPAIFDLTSDDLDDLSEILHTVATRMKRDTKSDWLSIALDAGEAAGQRTSHFEVSINSRAV